MQQTDNDDRVIRINTTEQVKEQLNQSGHIQPGTIVEIPSFKLVTEDSPILYEYMPLFDFSNPPVNPNSFASSLVETCKQHKALGLSANQCGFSYRVFVAGFEDNFVAFFNPIIKSKSEENVHMAEGCLSFPLLTLHITRPASVNVGYQDFNGVYREMELHGLSARVFQHEFDHMNGEVFLNRVKPLAREMGLKRSRKLFKKLMKSPEYQKTVDLITKKAYANSK